MFRSFTFISKAIAGAMMLTSIATAQNFATHVQTINAGIVILDADHSSTQLYGHCAAPFALYNLDSATNIKPAGWTFVNPAAMTAVTTTEQARWIEATGGAVGQYPNVGESVTKRSAAYWEVYLDSVSDEQLASFNLLLVNPGYYISLNPAEREKLRRFVDSGGVLWVDAGALPASNGVDQINNLPAPFSLVNGSGSSATYSDFNQTVLQQPFALTSGDLALLNENFSNALSPINLAADGASALSPLFGSVYADYFAAEPFTAVLSGSTTEPTGSITRIGEGFVVNTTRGISLKLNAPQGYSYTANRSYYPIEGTNGVTLSVEGVAAAKFAINAVSLAEEYRQSKGGSRGSQSSAIDEHAPLLNSFSLDINHADPGSTTLPQIQPVFYKGLMVVSSNGQIFVYNAQPGRNLDGDPTDDLGVQDFSLGSTYDMVWSSAQVGKTLSTPVCAEVPDADGTPVDQVFAVDTSGNLHAWSLMQRDSNQYLLGTTGRTEITNYPISPPTGASTLSPAANGIPNAPTVHEGVVYVADTPESNGQYYGRVWLVDARTGVPLSTSGENQWVIGGVPTTGAATSLTEFSGSPTVGYIPIYDNGGGSDKVVYVPTRPNAAANASCGLVSYWVGARGETPSAVQVVGSNLQVTTRASSAGAPMYTVPVTDSNPNDADPRGVKITLIAANGNPLSDSAMSQFFTGAVTTDSNNNLNFSLTGTGVTDLTAELQSNTVSVRVDYTIDWGHTGGAFGDVTASVTRGVLRFPDQAPTPVRQVMGGLALSPRGTLYATVADPNAAPLVAASDSNYGGSFYAIREQGRGNFLCVSRWDVYPQHTITLNQGSPTHYDEVLYDTDPVNAYVDANVAFGAADRRLRNFALLGSPSVRNGQVFISATAQKYFDIGALHILAPVSILLCFQAEPSVPEIPVGAFPNGSMLIQPDFAKSSAASVALGAPDQRSALASTNVSYDATSGFIELPSLMDSNAGQIQNCLSLSQPVIVRRSGQPDQLIDPSATSSPWTPLLWYQTFEGSQTAPGSSPVVTGDTVFVSMNSSLPNILANNGYTPVGVVEATQAQIAANDPDLFSVDYLTNASTGRPWLKQLWTIVPGGNPHILWPQTSGITSLSDYVVRLNQTVLGTDSKYAYGLAAGEGTLGVVADTGIYAFNRANFIVCDDGRVARFDPAGNPLYSSQSFVNSGDGGLSNGGLKKPLVKPTRAYDLGQNSMLIVDTGGNRIVAVDASGKEVRSIDHFQLDVNHLPDGYRANESGFASESDRLKQPADVVTFSNYVPPTPVIATNQTGEEYWVHYLIADKGNHRLVELVDRFTVSVDQATGNRSIGNPVVVPQTIVDPTTKKTLTVNVPQTGVLFWHSPSSVSGLGFDYNSISRVYLPGTGSAPGRFVYIAGVGNGATTTQTGPLSPSSTALGAPGSVGLGGIVIFDQFSTGTVLVFNRITGLPNLSNVPFWDYSLPTASWDPTQLAWDTKTAASRTNLDSKGNPIAKPFNDISSVTAKLIVDTSGATPTPAIAIMVAEADGVYEVEYNPLNSTAPNLGLTWMITNEAYQSMRHVAPYGQPDSSNPSRLRATYAQRLDNGDVLIVNGYNGKKLDGTSTTGEIVELAGTAVNGNGSYNPALTNLGFSTASLRFTLPPIQGLRGIVSPTFAQRK